MKVGDKVRVVDTAVHEDGWTEIEKFVGQIGTVTHIGQFWPEGDPAIDVQFEGEFLAPEAFGIFTENELEVI